jgi:hypothetical protein
MIVRSCIGSLVFDARLVETRAVRDVHLAADDRLDAHRLHRVVELDRPEHVAVIGDRARRHPELRDFLRELVGTAGAVEERIFCVEMEVNEGHQR